MDEYVNPEPPPEITQIKTEDLIGSTLFSKPWLCKLLLELIKRVETEDNDSNTPQNDDICSNITVKELDSGTEKDLCDLWDMSVEKDVCIILDELNAIEIFNGYIKKFYKVYPRATEILIGILVNMSTMCPEIRLKLVQHSYLIQHLFFKILAEMTDVHSVIQALNLFALFFSDTDTSRHLFIDFLHEGWPQVLESYLFILDQSLSPLLLDSAINFLFCVLDSDDDTLVSRTTVNENLAEAVCNAAMTRLKLERVQKTFNHSNFTSKTSEKDSRRLASDETPTPSVHRPAENSSTVNCTQFSEEEISAMDTLLNKYFLCLQTMSTCESGVEALFLKFDSIKQLTNEYLERCLATFNDWEIRTASSLKSSVGDSSMQNLLCIVSILNCVFVNEPAELVHMTGSLIEFLLKLVTFCSQYLDLFKELSKKNYDDGLPICQNYELVQVNLKDLFSCVKAQKTYESYHLKRLLEMIASCEKKLNEN